MSIYESLRTATTGLTTNKMRAALTMLGIIIGVASVVALLSVGEGVEASITGEIEGLGSNLHLCHGRSARGCDGAGLRHHGRRRSPGRSLQRARAGELVAPSMQGQLRV